MENPYLSDEIRPFSGHRITRNIFDPQRYVVSPEMVSVVNIAIALGQPILLTGESGTGKTMLAHYVAYQFKLSAPFIFVAKTDSTAIDLFYKYDSLRHFHDANSRAAMGQSPADYYERYITFQALGAAIRSKERSVVLIDEIDKAPRNFPNDLLDAIERMEFLVRETGEMFVASEENRPVVIITSNSERNLPDAFLRRCVYYSMPFPNQEMLLTILQQFVQRFEPKDLQYLVDFFYRARERSILKMPSTAELVQWTLLLESANFNPQILGNSGKRNNEQLGFLHSSLSVLAKTPEDLQVMHQLVDSYF